MYLDDARKQLIRIDPCFLPSLPLGYSLPSSLSFFFKTPGSELLIQEKAIFMGKCHDRKKALGFDKLQQ
jgi:hypothetical protein